MIQSLSLIAIFLLIYGPHLWVNYVLSKHHKTLDPMPGTGGELAVHLLSRFGLRHVLVVEGGKGEDCYRPSSNSVCLSPEVFHGKSLSAVAVAAHEVGHALQFNRKEPVSLLRGKYLNKAHRIQQVGVLIMMSIPIVGAIARVPQLAIVTAVLGALTMAASVMTYVVMLPEEFDASFAKALPILVDYVPAPQLPAIRRILQACALTYVAAALADIVRLWRWVALLK